MKDLLKYIVQYVVITVCQETVAQNDAMAFIVLRHLQIDACRNTIKHKDRLNSVPAFHSCIWSRSLRNFEYICASQA